LLAATARRLDDPCVAQLAQLGADVVCADIWEGALNVIEGKGIRCSGLHELLDARRF
jgi:hypothetical protein